MTDSELDRLMRRVLLDSLKLEWDREPEPKPPFVPSARYKRQVRAMLADPLAWERKRSAPLWKKAARRIAAVLLVISIGFGGLLAVSPTVRAALLQWVVEWYETHVTYRYTDNSTEAIPQYEITELPEGYAEDEEERVEWPEQADIVYKNEETGKTMYLGYIRMSQGALSDFVVREGLDTITPVRVQGCDGLYFQCADPEREWSRVTWTDPDSGLQFTIGAQLEKEEILHIAESVSLVE